MDKTPPATPEWRQWEQVNRLLDLAIDEDVGTGDVTTQALFPGSGQSGGRFRARAPGIMAGGEVARRLFARLGERYAGDAGAARIGILRQDGERFSPGDDLLEILGDTAIILMGERIALNLLQRLCAVASLTRRFVDLAAGTGAKIYDTRKTLPGHRALDKLAVRAGGGHNHRQGLYDMVLIKDNHLAAFGGPAKAVRAARKKTPLPVMVEVDSLEQLAEALTAEPDYVLLDNMMPGTLAEAVELTNRLCSGQGWRRPELEASGGINLTTAAAVAGSGVERISVGAITHGAGSIDIGLDFDPEAS
ncbi:MAG: carboxylating nicotinate-nucleotide diphosphorylase [Planctomycetota bacterium]|jgi:nicotinate-nucleotide pyrophosphorylase (carboxylating)|nr:carboxylating nicotinate-nucleotide diphosphorylase [Planctomycetota bacterium]